MFEIKIQGTKQVIDKIERVEAITKSEGLKKYLAQKMIAVINRLADERLSYDDNYKNHNKYQINSDSIVIYNDVQNNIGQYYSLILEYGSGVWAEKDHIGKTDTFKASGYMYWYVPEEKAPNLSAYNYEKIPTKKGIIYKVVGQTPKYIYEDSAKLIERNVARWVREYIKEELGGKL